MTKTRSVQAFASIGVNNGKDVMHIVGFDPSGAVVLRKKIRRLALESEFSKLPTGVVGLEACQSAHFISRMLHRLGHDPKIIPAMYVKPFSKGQKNDYNDAEAIAEAVLRPNLRAVPEKTHDQLDLQALHRVRDRLVSRRTATINQIRCFLLEHGIAVRPRTVDVRPQLQLTTASSDAANMPKTRRRLDRHAQASVIAAGVVSPIFARFRDKRAT